MVKRILFILTKEINGLHQAAYLLAFFTFLSQVLGLFRDRILAHTFGTGSTLDVYYAAFRVPDLVLVSAASIVSISILVPYLTERINESEDVGREFINNIFTAFFIFIIVVCAALFPFIPNITRFLFPGFAEADFSTLVTLTRVLLLSPIFLGLSNLFASITQVYKKFFVYALSPVLYNLGIIFGIVVLFPIFGIKGLAYGVVCGAILHVGIQVPVILEKKFFPRFRLPINMGYVKKVALTSLPRAVTLSIGQIAIVILIGIASTLSEGSITVFNFSFNLQSVPLAIIGVSYSLAAFPTLSRLFTEGDKTAFLEQVTTAARHIIYWSIPAIILFVVLRAQVVRTILGSGAFDWTATRLTAATLALFVFSVLAQSLIYLFVRSYYAMGNTRKPLIISLLGGLGIIGSSFLLLRAFGEYSMFQFFVEDLFRVTGIPGTTVLMLPLAYSLGMTFIAVLLWIAFHKDFKQFTFGVTRTLVQSFSAAVIMGFVTHRFLAIFDSVFDLQTLHGVFLQGFCAGVIGIATGGSILVLLGNIETKEVITTLRRRFWRVDVSVPDAEKL